MNLILDIGNTRIKLAVFQEHTIVESIVVSPKSLGNEITKMQKKYAIGNAIVSSVGETKLEDLKEIGSFQRIIILDHTVKVPFVNKYKTPKMLGVDRIALVSGATSQYPSKDVLVIDAGTCITYDFVNSKKEYFGGAISPGINMRYQSLNTFTANLPNLEKASFSLIGSDTAASMHSGVLNGILHEMDGLIAEYQDKYPYLTVLLTGGDTNFLAKKLKSSIFANPNFLLEGLNSILIHNLDE